MGKKCKKYFTAEERVPESTIPINNSNAETISSTNGEENENIAVNDENLFTLLKQISNNNEIYFHTTIFSLWVLITCLNVPFVLTWAHNFK